jgi:hypothetical protein
MLKFVILHCKKVISDFFIYDSAQFQNMIRNSALGCSLMYQVLTEF